MATIGIGLIAHPAIKWLVTTDRGVNEYIQQFILDRAPGDTVIVAGPPSREDLIKLRTNPDANIELPTVELTLKRERRDDGLAIRVVCSDEDTTSVQGWMLRAQSGPLPTEDARAQWH